MREVAINPTYVNDQESRHVEIIASRSHNCTNNVGNVTCATLDEITKQCGSQFFDEIYWIIYSVFITSAVFFLLVVICCEKNKIATLRAELKYFSDPDDDEEKKTFPIEIPE